MAGGCDRALFEQLVAGTAKRPLTNDEIAAELERQTLYHQNATAAAWTSSPNC
jgi:hypothetical protein